eukprot:447945-Rhodomonas_salina.5
MCGTEKGYAGTRRTETFWFAANDHVGVLSSYAMSVPATKSFGTDSGRFGGQKELCLYGLRLFHLHPQHRYPPTRLPYAMAGTDIENGGVSAYALPMRCPVLNCRSLCDVRAYGTSCFAMSGTDTPYGAAKTPKYAALRTVGGSVSTSPVQNARYILCPCYSQPAAICYDFSTRSPVLTWRMVLPDHDRS